ncbi:hypothetical protein EDD86DRAFT_220876 [Gorgonomyces haynaldii]|nr:hypothetical protein EDD86DRAFT_220876 [Gorgonomyces haynaldii]
MEKSSSGLFSKFKKATQSGSNLQDQKLKSSKESLSRKETRSSNSLQLEEQQLQEPRQQLNTRTTEVKKEERDSQVSVNSLASNKSERDRSTTLVSDLRPNSLSIKSQEFNARRLSKRETSGEELLKSLRKAVAQPEQPQSSHSRQSSFNRTRGNTITSQPTLTPQRGQKPTISTVQSGFDFKPSPHTPLQTHSPLGGLPNAGSPRSAFNKKPKSAFEDLGDTSGKVYCFSRSSSGLCLLPPDFDDQGLFVDGSV